MSTAYIAFGSNLGDRKKNIQDALELLKLKGVLILKTSSIMESDPVGGPAQGKYLNGVVKAQTRLTPHELLQTLLDIEQSLGRVRTIRNAPRIIDLDIILFDDIILDEENLKIPHPRMKDREFVIKPLLEIEPDISV